MKAIKQIGQVISAVIYSMLYVGVFVLIIITPLSWLISLPTKAMILVMFFMGSVIEGLLAFLMAFVLIPYKWLVKKNMVSLVISIAIMIAGLLYCDVILWKEMLGVSGWLPIVFSAIITMMSIQGMLMSIPVLIEMYNKKI